MKQYIIFVKKWKKKVVLLAGSLLLAAISGMLLFPHLMMQWSYDRPFGIVHVLLGVLTGIAGLAGLWIVYVKAEQQSQRNWKKDLPSILAAYLILQLLSSVLLGLLGVLLHHIVQIPYETTKQILYLITDIFQNLVRMGTLFFLSEKLRDRDWKNDKKVLFKGSGLATVLSAISIAWAFLPVKWLGTALRTVWEIVYILFFVIYFIGEGGKE